MKDPSSCGVVSRFNDGKVKIPIEKTKKFISNEALTGLYFFRNIGLIISMSSLYQKEMKQRL